MDLSRCRGLVTGAHGEASGERQDKTVRAHHALFRKLLKHSLPRSALIMLLCPPAPEPWPRRLDVGCCRRRLAIHGTNRPESIGTFASYGCIPMLNQDITDLFERVDVGTQVMAMR
ncbi:MAG: L,D-transpeptidase family protein [Rhodopila sp.]